MAYLLSPLVRHGCSWVTATQHLAAGRPPSQVLEDSDFLSHWPQLDLNQWLRGERLHVTRKWTLTIAVQFIFILSCTVNFVAFTDIFLGFHTVFVHDLINKSSISLRQILFPGNIYPLITLYRCLLLPLSFTKSRALGKPSISSDLPVLCQKGISQVCDKMKSTPFANLAMAVSCKGCLMSTLADLITSNNTVTTT